MIYLAQRYIKRRRAMARKKKVTEGTGLEPNIAALLSYVGLWVSGIVFLVLEKKDKFVRFHAIQSIIVFGAFSVVWIVLSIINSNIWLSIHGLWIFFTIIMWLLGVFAFILWLVLILKAYKGEKYKLPIAGDIAAKNA
jgi:uncharacterized membrane protein